MRLNLILTDSFVNNLKSTNNLIGKSSKKLSKGLSVSSASDNASGLAISEKMKAQIRGLEQGSKNIQDTVSLLQVAEGSIESINSELQRVRELVISANTDVLNKEDKSIIYNEINSILEDISCIAEDTKFNGKSLLNGIDAYGDSGVGLLPHPKYAIEGLDYSRLTDSGVFISSMPMGDKTYLTISTGYTTYSTVVSASEPGYLDAGDIKLVSIGYPDITLTVKEKTNENAKIGVDTGLCLKINSQVGANEGDVRVVKVPNLTLNSLGLEGATDELKKGTVNLNGLLSDVDSALSKVSDALTVVGVSNNRLSVVDSLNEKYATNLSNANSKIVDVDMAKELVENSKLQILSNSNTFIGKMRLLTADKVFDLLKS